MFQLIEMILCYLTETLNLTLIINYSYFFVFAFFKRAKYRSSRML